MNAEILTDLSNLTTDSVPDQPRPFNLNEEKVISEEPSPQKLEHNEELSSHKEESKEDVQEDKKEEEWCHEEMKKPPELSEKEKRTSSKSTKTISYTLNYNINKSQNVHIGNNIVLGQSAGAQNDETEEKVKKTKDITRVCQSLCRVNSDVMDYVAEHIGHAWKDLGRKLHYQDGQLDAFEADNHRLKDRAYSMLLDWTRMQSSNATVGVLCTSLWNLKITTGRKIVSAIASKIE